MVRRASPAVEVFPRSAGKKPVGKRLGGMGHLRVLGQLETLDGVECG